MISATTERNQKGFQAYLNNTRETIDLELSKLMSQLHQFRLSEEMRYALLSPGKRLRATLSILSAQSVGGNGEDIKQLALAIELLHTATLIHDDILDQDSIRRNVPAVHKRWSINQAILAGDALLSLAIRTAAPYGERIMTIFSDAGLLLCEGEYMDLDNESMQVWTSEEQYLEKIRKKSASLFKASTLCGAIVGQGSEVEIEALSEFGEDFGMAYQIKDDLLDTVSLRNEVPTDLKQCRATLPLIHFCKSLSAPERKKLRQRLNDITARNDQSLPGLLDDIFEQLGTSGSLAYCKSKINEYIDGSAAEIKQLDDSTYRFYLVQMAESLRPQ